MHKKPFTPFMLALAFATSICLFGCGGGGAPSPETEPPAETGSDASAEQGSESEGPSADAEASFDLSPYESLESNSVVIILADGSVETYDPASAGQYYHNDGVSEAFSAINDAFSDNAVKAKARYDGATIVVRAPISIIDDSQSIYLAPLPTGAWFGFGSYRSHDQAGLDVIDPYVAVKNCEDAILGLDLDKGDEVLVAGPLAVNEYGDVRFLVIEDIYAIEAV